MSLIIKYITKHDSPINNITVNFTGDLTLKILLISFLKLGLNMNEINSLKFIINSQQMTGLEDKYIIGPNDTQMIYLLSIDSNLKEKLISIFNKHNNEPTTAKEPKVESTIVEPKMTDSIIENQNKLTIKLFEDPDFRTLIKIYQSKPELFNILLQYTQSGDIIEDKPQIYNISDLSEKERLKYNEMLLFIKSLKLNISDDEIMQQLIKYKGHLNLTLRTILYSLVK